MRRLDRLVLRRCGKRGTRAGPGVHRVDLAEQPVDVIGLAHGSIVARVRRRRSRPPSRRAPPADPVPARRSLPADARPGSVTHPWPMARQHPPGPAGRVRARGALRARRRPVRRSPARSRRPPARPGGSSPAMRSGRSTARWPRSSAASAACTCRRCTPWPSPASTGTRPTGRIRSDGCSARAPTSPPRPTGRRTSPSRRSTPCGVMHRRVQGTASDGRAYSAGGPAPARMGAHRPGRLDALGLPAPGPGGGDRPRCVRGRHGGGRRADGGRGSATVPGRARASASPASARSCGSTTW